MTTKLPSRHGDKCVRDVVQDEVQCTNKWEQYMSDELKKLLVKYFNIDNWKIETGSLVDQFYHPYEKLAPQFILQKFNQSQQKITDCALPDKIIGQAVQTLKMGASCVQQVIQATHEV